MAIEPHSNLTIIKKSHFNDTSAKIYLNIGVTQLHINKTIEKKNLTSALCVENNLLGMVLEHHTN